MKFRDKQLKNKTSDVSSAVSSPP